MFVLTYFESSIYMKIRQLCDKSNIDKIGIIIDNCEISDAFLHRFIVNKWNIKNFYAIINEINKNSVSNLIKTADIWTGLIIEYNEKNNKDYLFSIISFCKNNNINVYLSEKYNFEYKENLFSLEEFYES